MKFQCQAEDLSSSVRACHWFRADSGCGSQLHIAATDHVMVSVTDGSHVANLHVDASVDEPGVAVAPYRLADEFLRSVAGELSVELRSDGRLSLSAGRDHAEIATYTSETWPRLKAVEGEQTEWTVEIVRALSRVWHAADVSSNRPSFTGIAVGDGWAAATDGHRLAAVEVPIPSEPTVLPRQLLRAAIDVARDQPVLFSTDGLRAWFEVGSS
ncbi:MAG: dnaN, partial [Actinomycetia bacterium]|nr:dnaN [Actinomycetes bacterium]